MNHESKVIAPAGAPYIWTRRPGIIEPREPLRLPARGIAGRFKIVGRKRDGRSRVLADWFPNLITNAGMDYLGDPSEGYLGRCFVGTGTNAPSVGDTGLQTQLAFTQTQQDANDFATSEAPYYGAFQKTFRFSEGAAEGNIAEVGIGPFTGSLFNRARILDSEGNPTTITVLADEILDVVYEIRNYSPDADLVYSDFDFGGSDLIRVVTIRPGQVNNADYWSMFLSSGSARCTAGVRSDELSVSNSNPGIARAASSAIVSTTTTISNSIGSGASSGNIADYVGGNHYVDNEIVWGLNDANFGGGGVLSLYFRCGDNGSSSTGNRARFGRYQVGFDTGLPKDDTKVLSFTFRNTWARATI